MNEPLDRLESLFAAALQEPPAGRAAYLDTACADDPALRQRVEALLRAQAAAGDFLKLSSLPPVVSVDEMAATERPSTIIGSYKLLEQIGEGGMGAVWMAQQTEPVRRLVAIKLIKAGMDSGQVIARFEAERQALALMDHPHIAKVFDAGTTVAGRPYFVMELVKGVPITRFCDERRLSLRERLELFLPVCQAVQHAHQKGIIHRDLKPSNVLIALYDGRPVPKVIDFGVAKATAQKLTERTLFTEFGSVVGTLEYMSPEQAELNQLDIDTRSDIYSLGILLYELLTGTTPLERKRTQEIALLETLRLIREEEPQPPSVRLSSTAELPSIAENRGLEATRLSGLVRGELDWIVMKCLDKDRARRYETANGLELDLRRYLADETVEACPPSAGYRLRKFARRNKKALAMAALVGVTLLLAVITLAISYARVNHALSDRLEALADRTAALDAKSRALATETQAKDDLRKALGREQEALYVHTIALAEREWQANRGSRARELLDTCPEEKRHWEWYYLKQQCRTQAPTSGSGGPRTLSPDGRWLAIAQPSAIELCEAPSGRPVERLHTRPNDATCCLAFSGDGSRLAVGSHAGKITLWDLGTRQELRTIAAHTGQLWSLALSQDGHLLASGGQDEKLILWNGNTGEVLNQHPGYCAVACLAFSPDGQRLAVGIRGSLRPGPRSQFTRILDASTGQELCECRPKGAASSEPALSLAFSPNGDRLASGGGTGNIRVWDGKTGELQLVLNGHQAPVSQLAWFGNSHLAAGDYSGVVKCWDMAHVREMQTFRGHESPVASIAASADGGHLISTSLDGALKVWSPGASPEYRILCRGPANLYSLAFSPDGRRLATAAARSPVMLWDAITGEKQLTLAAPCNNMPLVAFDARGERILATTADPAVKVWDAATGRELHTLRGQEIMVGSAAFSPDGQFIVSAGGDGIARLWDAETGKELRVLYQSRFGFPSVAYRSDGQQLAISLADVIHILDPVTGREIHPLKGQKGRIGRVVFGPKGSYLASAGDDGTIRIWDTRTGQGLLTVDAHFGQIFPLTFSPDGRRLAAAGTDRRLRIWDTTTGKELLSLHTGVMTVSCLAFSPDGHRLAAGSSEGLVRVWDGSPLENKSPE